jgi:FtsH-binding integral membrane protein
MLDLHRLRRGEWMIGAGAIVLLASMFLLKWYRQGASASVNGWHGLTHVRWLVLATVVCGLALVYTQASRRAPAVPAVLSVIVTVVGLLTALALLYRVVINEPGSQKPGAFVGLISAVAIFCGGYLSMRDEGLAERDEPMEIETVQLPESGQRSTTGEPQGS